MDDDPGDCCECGYCKLASAIYYMYIVGGYTVYQSWRYVHG